MTVVNKMGGCPREVRWIKQVLIAHLSTVHLSAGPYQSITTGIFVNIQYAVFIPGGMGFVSTDETAEVPWQRLVHVRAGTTGVAGT